MDREEFVRKIKEAKKKEEDERLSKEQVIEIIEKNKLGEYARLIEGENKEEEYTVCIKYYEEVKGYRVITRGERAVIRADRLFFDEAQAYTYALNKLRWLKECQEKKYSER